MKNEQMVNLISRAMQAPSSHNTQPWFFRIAPSTIDLYADRTRALPVNDPEDRELTISCGCALMNLRVAASSCEPGLQVQLLPSAEDPDWLARVTFTAEQATPATEAALSGFIEKRRTYRKHFTASEVPTTTIQHLIEAAQAEGGLLHTLSNPETQQRVANLVAEGDAAQWADPSWRRELAAWMHPKRRGDGLTVPALAAPVTQFFVRNFDMGGGVGTKDKELAETAPLLAVLGTERDEPGDWLLAGQALQRVLLTACQQGLQASYLNQPIQVAALRSKLQSLIGTGFPQILLRVGYPPDELAATPRREVKEVITDIA